MMLSKYTEHLSLLSVGPKDYNLSRPLLGVCPDLWPLASLFGVQLAIGQRDWVHSQCLSYLQDQGTCQQGGKDCKEPPNNYWNNLF